MASRVTGPIISRSNRGNVGRVTSVAVTNLDERPDSLGLRHVPWVITKPVALFRGFEATGADGPRFRVLLGRGSLIG